MSYICSDCGKLEHSSRVLPRRLCQACYNYYRKGGTANPLPAPGTIQKDERGCVICHICGRAYVRLGSHIKESHGMSIAEYKEQYGLCANCRTTESRYSKMMYDYAYANGMPERLQQTGFDTRVKVGERDKRLGKKTRLQESIDKQMRKARSKQHGV